MGTEAEASDETGNPLALNILDPDDHKDGKQWFIHRSVVNEVSESFKRNYHGAYTCYSDVPNSTLTKWWEHFRMRYKWERANADKVKSDYIVTLKKRLRDVISDHCRNNSKPWWMNSGIWEQLMAKRETPHFKAKSQASSRNNKQGKKAGSKHSQGSVSSECILENMAHKLKRPVRSYELFKKTHLKKDGSFTEDRAKLIWEKFEEILKTQDPSSSLQTQEDAFYKVLGGWNEKGRIYGLGSSAHRFYGHVSSSRSSSSQLSVGSKSSHQPSYDDLLRKLEASEAARRASEAARESQQKELDKLRQMVLEIMQNQPATSPDCARTE